MITLSLTAFSQTVTDTNYVRIPTLVARQIVLDLTYGDECKEELEATQNVLMETEHSSYMKDTLINNFVGKMQLYDKQINMYKEKEKIYEQNFKIVNKENKQLKRNLRMTGVSSMVIVTALILGIFIK